MKMMKQILVLAAAGAFALSAHATFNIGTSLPTITISSSLGSQSGTLDFAISAQSGFYVESGTLANAFGNVPVYPATFATVIGVTTGPNADFGQGATSDYLNPSGANSIGLSANTGYNIIVDWTVSEALPGQQDLLDLNFKYSTTGVTGTYSPDTLLGVINVSTVPEPAQTVAGAMLLGCGGLVFAGRRMFKKQNA